LITFKKKKIFIKKIFHLSTKNNAQLSASKLNCASKDQREERRLYCFHSSVGCMHAVVVESVAMIRKI